MTNESYNRKTVSIHTRPTLLIDPVDAKITTLESLSANGVIDDVAMHSWPAEVPVDDREQFGDVLATFSLFSDWADLNDVSVRPPFAVRTKRSSITDESTTVLSTPVMSLAVYVDDRLQWVYPHTDGETTHTVTDGVARIKTGELPWRKPVPVEDTPRCLDACDACQGGLVNVQGVLACRDCLRPAGDAEETRPPAELATTLLEF